MAQVRSLRSNAQNLQPVHWPPLDPPTGRRRNSNNAPNNVPENSWQTTTIKMRLQCQIKVHHHDGPPIQWQQILIRAPRKGRRSLTQRTEGYQKTKKNEITTMEGFELRKYLLGRQAALGGVVTNIPIEHNTDGTVKTTANLIKQYQLIPFQTLRQEAYKCYA